MTPVEIKLFVELLSRGLEVVEYPYLYRYIRLNKQYLHLFNHKKSKKINIQTISTVISYESDKAILVICKDGSRIVLRFSSSSSICLFYKYFTDLIENVFHVPISVQSSM